MKWIATIVTIVLGLCLTAHGVYGQESPEQALPDEVVLWGWNVCPGGAQQNTNEPSIAIVHETGKSCEELKYLEYNAKRIQIRPLLGVTNAAISCPNLAAQLDLRPQSVVAQIAPSLVTNVTTLPNPDEAVQACSCSVCAAQKLIERTEIGLITYVIVSDKKLPAEGRLLWSTNRFYWLASGTNDVSTNRVFRDVALPLKDFYGVIHAPPGPRGYRSGYNVSD